MYFGSQANCPTTPTTRYEPYPSLCQDHVCGRNVLIETATLNYCSQKRKKKKSLQHKEYSWL